MSALNSDDVVDEAEFCSLDLGGGGGGGGRGQRGGGGKRSRPNFGKGGDVTQLFPDESILSTCGRKGRSNLATVTEECQTLT